MTQLRTLTVSVAASVLVWLGAPAAAHAVDACDADADCGTGFECQVVGTSGCAAPACSRDTPCEPIECEPTVEKACVPAHCNVDADCAAGMVCHEWSRAGDCATSSCSCPSEEPDCTCPAPVCDPPTSEKICTPRYALPCEAAADCGDGFTCEEQQSCGCSGYAGSDGGAEPAPGATPQPPADGDADAPAAPLPPECSCNPSGEFACVPKQIACTTDDACPEGWSCLVAANDEPACDGDGCAARPAPEPSERLCFPNYYGGLGSSDDAGGWPTKGEDNGGGTGESDPQNPGLAGGDADADSKDSAACQMGRAPASSGALAVVALLGALAGLTRRRAQPRA